jgi:hypothetical protein
LDLLKLLQTQLLTLRVLLLRTLPPVGPDPGEVMTRMARCTASPPAGLMLLTDKWVLQRALPFSKLANKLLHRLDGEKSTGFRTRRDATLERTMPLRDQMNQGKPSLLLDLLNLNLAIKLGYELPFLLWVSSLLMLTQMWTVPLPPVLSMHLPMIPLVANGPGRILAPVRVFWYRV